MKPQPLQEWANEQTIDDEMLWKRAWGRQIMFVRDDLTRLVGAGLRYEEREQLVDVISTHTSKSILLPVYSMERQDLGLRLVMRQNFYNWKISVISKAPVFADFSGLFYTEPPIDPGYTGDPLHEVYFEGFPSELIFGYYGQDQRQWSAEIWGNDRMWTTLFLLMRSLKVIKPFTWHTRESHKEELRKGV